MQTIIDEIELLTIQLYYAAFDEPDDRLAQAFLIAVVRSKEWRRWRARPGGSRSWRCGRFRPWRHKAYDFGVGEFATWCRSHGGRRAAPAREDLPPSPVTERALPGPPLTIAQLRAWGMTHLTLMCAVIICRRQKRLSFDNLRLPAETLFPDIEKSRKFVWAGCCARKLEAFPDWSTVRVHGKPT